MSVMKNLCLLTVLTGALLGTGHASPTPGRLSVKSPVFYSLEQLEVADTKPTQHVWVLMNRTGRIVLFGSAAVFPSLASPALRAWVDQQPAGTTITTVQSLPQPFVLVKIKPGTMPGGEGSPAPKPTELSDFDQFCRSKGVHFLLIYINA